MKLHLSRPAATNLFSSAGGDFVVVNGTRYQTSLVVTPERLIDAWSVATFEALAADRLEVLTTLALDVVLLGTGARIRFPRPEVLRPLIEAGIGVEVMDVPAACRTYNILVAEDRKVAAALILG